MAKNTNKTWAELHEMEVLNPHELTTDQQLWLGVTTAIMELGRSYTMLVLASTVDYDLDKYRTEVEEYLTSPTRLAEYFETSFNGATDPDNPRMKLLLYVVAEAVMDDKNGTN